MERKFVTLAVTGVLAAMVLTPAIASAEPSSASRIAFSETGAKSAGGWNQSCSNTMWSWGTVTVRGDRVYLDGGFRSSDPDGVLELRFNRADGTTHRKERVDPGNFNYNSALRHTKSVSANLSVKWLGGVTFKCSQQVY
ncbi:hypothetical protein [Amycolatopsis alba]|uniref:Secreted protein n=1 Tax=Amycolatopsis alba DSM 44262 TaxID=1125972 RepID=A0A229S797_AMYAL|nr:hypothetical protein [Amycolatopsis alba]OXM54464.1 hypothetical protein CFP75_05190 [Amycolatopsis alba DSM 44262]